MEEMNMKKELLVMKICNVANALVPQPLNVILKTMECLVENQSEETEKLNIAKLKEQVSQMDMVGKLVGNNEKITDLYIVFNRALTDEEQQKFNDLKAMEKYYGKCGVQMRSMVPNLDAGQIAIELEEDGVSKTDAIVFALFIDKYVSSISKDLKIEKVDCQTYDI